MASMSFIPELKAFLKEYGAIYTVRKYKMIDSIVEIEGLGEYHRIPLGTIEKIEDLIPYVKESGFNTVEDWWKKIKYFIPQPGIPKYLYRVE